MALTVVDRPSLAERTTLRLGGHALAEVAVRSEGDLDGLADRLAGLGGTPLVLGHGSNLLARDGELPLVLVRPAAEADGEGGGVRAAGTTVRVPAGLPLPVLLSRLRKLGLSGLEGLAGIPGSVGGAVAMNAGSYGVEFTGPVRRVRVWTPGTGLVWLERGGWKAGYRHFRPVLGAGEGQAQGLGWLGWLIWEVELELTPAPPEDIAARMAGHLEAKRATQPLAAASAGCVFKNPPRESAGRLLDRAGLKGFRLGGMAFSELHANFMVNCAGPGEGRSDEALELIDVARGKVREMFGLELSLEVRIVPCP